MEEIRALKERLEGERPVDWEGFPDIGLYMDQLISYMPRQLIHYGEGEALTSAMVNNYIKDGAMPRAEGKRYSRTHLAYLTALCALKQVLSVKDAGLLLASAAQGREPSELYEQFRMDPWTPPPGRRTCPAWLWPWPCAATPTSWPASAFWSCCGPSSPPMKRKRRKRTELCSNFNNNGGSLNNGRLCDSD